MPSEIDQVCQDCDMIVLDLSCVDVTVKRSGKPDAATVADPGLVSGDWQYDEGGDMQVFTRRALVQIGGDTGITSIVKGNIVVIDGEDWKVETVENASSWAVNCRLTKETRRSKHHRSHVSDL